MALTARQRDVVQLLIAGHSVAEIATSLRCTEATVRAHIQAIAASIDDKRHPPMRRILVHGARLVGNG